MITCKIISVVLSTLYLSRLMSGKEIQAVGPFIQMDLSAIWKNRPLMVSASGQPIRPTINLCPKCHDTNSAIREASLSLKTEPTMKETWALTLLLEKVNSSSENTSSKSIYSFFLWVFRLVPSSFMICLALFMGLMYWNSHSRYFPPEPKEHKDQLLVPGITSPSPLINKPAILRVDTNRGSESTQDDSSLASTPSMSISSVTSKNSQTTTTPPRNNGSVFTPTRVDRIRKNPLDIRADRSFMSDHMSPESPTDLLLSPTTRRNRRYDQMSDLIMKQAKRVNTREDCKNDLAFILFVCNIVETRTLKKDNINKKQLVIDTLKKLFTYDEQEAKVLDRNIEFLHTNGLIKKDTIIKQMQSFWGKKK